MELWERERVKKNGGEVYGNLLDSEPIHPVHAWTRDEVSSCDCSEKSHGHVNCRCLHCKAVNIDRERHEVDIVFFVKKRHHPGRFERETLGRTAVSKVSLDTVTGVAPGQWINTNCWQKTI